MPPPGQIQIWWATPDSVSDRALDVHRRALSADELASVSRFVFDRDRRQALLTRVLVRHVLARQEGGLEPQGWRFERTEHGRPVIANAGFEWLAFNLSHTPALVVCAVAMRVMLGVDVEPLTRAAPLEIAARHFSPEEARDLSRTPPGTRERRFFQYWTLKEAFAKALGRGLQLPLQDVAFTLRPDGITVALSQELVAMAGGAERWRFHSGDVGSDHVLAVACRTDHALDLSFHAARALFAADDSSPSH